MFSRSIALANVLMNMARADKGAAGRRIILRHRPSLACLPAMNLISFELLQISSSRTGRAGEADQGDLPVQLLRRRRRANPGEGLHPGRLSGRGVVLDFPRRGSLRTMRSSKPSMDASGKL